MTGTGPPGTRAIFLAGHSQNRSNSGYVSQVGYCLNQNMKSIRRIFPPNFARCVVESQTMSRIIFYHKKVPNLLNNNR